MNPNITKTPLNDEKNWVPQFVTANISNTTIKHLPFRMYWSMPFLFVRCWYFNVVFTSTCDTTNFSTLQQAVNSTLNSCNTCMQAGCRFVSEIRFYFNTDTMKFFIFSSSPVSFSETPI